MMTKIPSGGAGLSNRSGSCGGLVAYLEKEQLGQWFGQEREAVAGYQVTAELASQLANGPSWALGQAKRIIYSGYDMPLEQAAELEGVTITTAMGRRDGREGIAAFVEKRRPKFDGS